jgi:hypothetical protein
MRRKCSPVAARVRGGKGDQRVQLQRALCTVHYNLNLPMHSLCRKRARARDAYVATGLPASPPVNLPPRPTAAPGAASCAPGGAWAQRGEVAGQETALALCLHAHLCRKLNCPSADPLQRWSDSEGAGDRQQGSTPGC